MENVPEMYRFGKESGLNRVEDGDDLLLFDIDVGDG